MKRIETLLRWMPRLTWALVAVIIGWTILAFESARISFPFHCLVILALAVLISMAGYLALLIGWGRLHARQRETEAAWRRSVETVENARRMLAATEFGSFIPGGSIMSRFILMQLVRRYGVRGVFSISDVGEMVQTLFGTTSDPQFSRIDVASELSLGLLCSGWLISVDDTIDTYQLKFGPKFFERLYPYMRSQQKLEEVLGPRHEGPTVPVPLHFDEE